MVEAGGEFFPDLPIGYSSSGLREHDRNITMYI